MKLAFVSPYPPSASVSDYSLQLTRALSKLVDDIIVITKKGDQLFSQRAVYPLLDNSNPSSYLRAYTLVKNYEADIVHVQDDTFFFTPWLPLLVRKINIPVVVTAHEVLIDGAGGFFRRLYANQNRLVEPFVTYFLLDYGKRLYQNTQRIIVHNAMLKARLVSCYKVPSAKITVIPHGSNVHVSVKQDYSRQNDLLFFGSVTPHKGLELLVEAFEEIYREEPHVTLTIIGRLPPLTKRKWYAKFIKRVKKSEAKKNIQVKGFVKCEDLEKSFPGFDMLILPYCDVSHSGVAAFASAYGLPIIATKVGGFPYQIRNRENGLLVNPDSSKAIAQAVLQLLNNQEMRGKLGKSARMYAEKCLSWEMIAEQHLKLYEEVLDD